MSNLFKSISVLLLLAACGQGPGGNSVELSPNSPDAPTSPNAPTTSSCDLLLNELQFNKLVKDVEDKTGKQLNKLKNMKTVEKERLVSAYIMTALEGTHPSVYREIVKDIPFYFRLVKMIYQDIEKPGTQSKTIQNCSSNSKTPDLQITPSAS
jgi:hypothetical protein